MLGFGKNGVAMKRILASLILMTLATPTGAGFDEGLAAAKRGNYATAMRELRPLPEMQRG